MSSRELGRVGGGLAAAVVVVDVVVVVVVIFLSARVSVRTLGPPSALLGLRFFPAPVETLYMFVRPVFLVAGEAVAPLGVRSRSRGAIFVCVQAVKYATVTPGLQKKGNSEASLESAFPTVNTYARTLRTHSKWARVMGT